MVELESTQNFVDNQIIGKNTNLSKSAQLYKPDFQNKKNQLKKKNWQRKKPESVSRTFFKKIKLSAKFGGSISNLLKRGFAEPPCFSAFGKCFFIF